MTAARPFARAWWAGWLAVLLLTACAERYPAVSASSRVDDEVIAATDDADSVIAIDILNGAELTLHGSTQGMTRLRADRVSVEPRNLGPFRVDDINQLRLDALEVEGVLVSQESAIAGEAGGRRRFEETLERLYERIPGHYGKVTRIVAESPVLQIYPQSDANFFTHIEAGLLVYEPLSKPGALLYNVRVSDSRRSEQLFIARAIWNMDTMQLEALSEERATLSVWP